MTIIASYYQSKDEVIRNFLRFQNISAHRIYRELPVLGKMTFSRNRAILGQVCQFPIHQVNEILSNPIKEGIYIHSTSSINSITPISPTKSLLELPGQDEQSWPKMLEQINFAQEN